VEVEVEVGLGVAAAAAAADKMINSKPPTKFSFKLLSLTHFKAARRQAVSLTTRHTI